MSSAAHKIASPEEVSANSGGEKLENHGNQFTVEDIIRMQRESHETLRIAIYGAVQLEDVESLQMAIENFIELDRRQSELIYNLHKLSSSNSSSSSNNQSYGISGPQNYQPPISQLSTASNSTRNTYYGPSGMQNYQPPHSTVNNSSLSSQIPSNGPSGLQNYSSLFPPSLRQFNPLINGYGNGNLPSYSTSSTPSFASTGTGLMNPNSNSNSSAANNLPRSITGLAGPSGLPPPSNFMGPSGLPPPSTYMGPSPPNPTFQEFMERNQKAFETYFINGTASLYKPQ